MSDIAIRYIVDDTEAALRFYAEHLDFDVEVHPAPGFALLRRGALRLLLNEPGAGGAGQTLPDGREPSPGGWNRLQLQVEQLSDWIDRLRAAGVPFRGQRVEGKGGDQILVEDPAGNPVELFERKERPGEETVDPIPEAPIMISSAVEQYGGVGPAALHLFVPDVDRTYAQAVDCGAESIRDPEDQFYGDRTAGVRDRWGNEWWIATHIEDVPPEEIRRREREFRRSDG